MARPIAFRHAGRILAASIGPGTCLSAASFLRPAAIRLDSLTHPSGAPPSAQVQRSRISTKAVRQLSSGSLAGKYHSIPDSGVNHASLTSKTFRLWCRDSRCLLLPHASLPGQLLRPVRLRKSSTRSEPCPSLYHRLVLITLKVASRYGIDLPKMMGVKKLLHESSFWRRMGGSPWFSASFIATFTLAAFVRL